MNDATNVRILRSSIHTDRPTIGFLNWEIEHEWSLGSWLGICDAARQHDVNLLSFIGGIVSSSQTPGGSVNASQSLEGQADILYALADAEYLNGLIVFNSGLTINLSDSETEAFCRRPGVPVVTIEGAIPGVPCITYGNYDGICLVMDHLIEEHGYRRIAFVGLQDHQIGFQERWRAYTDSMKKYDLPIDEALYYPFFSDEFFQRNEGPIPAECVQRILAAGAEAVVGVCDWTSIHLINMLRARNVRIPQDIAVASFDDFLESRVITPSLTTINPGWHELGQQAVRSLLDLLKGDSVSTQIPVLPRLMVRQSCGCLDTEVQHAAVTGNTGKSPASISDRSNIALNMMHAVEGSTTHEMGQLVDDLLQGFLAEMRGEDPGVFLGSWDTLLRHVIAHQGEISAWHDALSVLRRETLGWVQATGATAQAENLWQQARVLLGKMAERAQAHQRLLDEEQFNRLRAVGEALITTFDVAKLMDVLAERLPQLGISRCYLSLYEDPVTYKYPAPAPEWSRLILAYDERGRTVLPVGGQRFRSRLLGPSGCFGDTRVNLVAKPLFFGHEQIGFVLFEAGPREGNMYEALRSQISSALQGALLVQRVQERTVEIARQKYILDTFMANVPDSIYFKDRHSHITQANQALAQRVGLRDPAELVGKSDFDLFPAEQAQSKYEQEQAILRTGQPLLALEEPGAGGAWALTTKMPLRDEHGVVIGTFGISRDITKLKAIEVALHEAKETAEHAQRAAETANRAKSEFLANMSHELRTPLNGILGYAQILNRDPEFPTQYHEAIDIIQKSGEHLLTLITDILDLAKIEAHKLDLYRTPFNFPKFLDEIAGIIRMRAHAKNQNFQYEHPPGLPAEVYADERRLRQVLLNLLGNAVKFTRNGGTVQFKIVDCGLGTGDGDPSTSHTAHLRFEISDTGVGMTPEQLAVIFHPFEQVGNPQDRIAGTGLGLAISRELVRLMDSDIQVMSEFGRGSTFWYDLTLPIMQEHQHASLSDRQILIGYGGRQRQVLIVDDDATNRRVLRDLLKPLGFACAEAENGQEALEKARDTQPDVILLDLVMPVMDGFEAVRHIRRDSALADVVVIAVSASAFDVDQARSLSAGCQAFLSKPVDTRSLFQILKNHLQLEWLYQERDADDAARALRPESPCVVPPHDELKHLHNLTLRGDLLGAQEHAVTLADNDATFQPFAAQLTQLAKTYQDEHLLAFLERCLEGEEGDAVRLES